MNEILYYGLLKALYILKFRYCYIPSRENKGGAQYSQYLIASLHVTYWRYCGIEFR